jgi:hypothetical protein
MKIHLGWIKWTAGAAIVAVGAGPAAAQYPPYRPMPVMPTATQSPVAATQLPAAATQPTAPQPTAASQLTTGYGPQVPYVAYREGSVQAPAQRAATTATATAASPAPTRYQATPYPVTQPAPQSYRVAQLTPPASASNQPAGQYQAAAPYQPMMPAYPQTAAPADRYGQSMYVAQQPAPVPPQGETDGDVTTNGGTAGGTPLPAPMNGAARNGSAAPATMSEGYANGVYNSSAGASGCNNGYNYGNACGSYDAACDAGHDSMWFGGVYFLYMERDNGDRVNLSAAMPDAVVVGNYYPTADTTVLVSSDYDFEPGVEVRFGCTFSFGDSCNTCNTGCGGYGYGYGGCNNGVPCCSSDIYAWEVGWWGLDENENNATYVVDQTSSGMYGLVDFAGLVYDYDNNGFDPADAVNNQYDSDMPLTAPSSEVLAQCVRTNFQVQNLELNIFRLPVCGSGCGCSSGCNSCGCDDGWGMAYSAYGSCGVRYFRIDDDFLYGTEFTGTSGQTSFNGWSSADNELFYDVEVDNQLIGPQVGWTMNYAVGCKWNFFLNSTFGVFNNHINSRQRMNSGDGDWAYFEESGQRFDLDDSKDDISFLGELRLGGSYDVTCNWRAIVAYRAIAATGLATSVGQIPDNFYNSAEVGINSNDSMIVHGVQVGAECRY